MLYLRVSYLKASPKAISGRTSYLRVRLEFHRYPHVIVTFFNRYTFGPPCPFTGTSACTWIGHPVSGLQHTTSFALLRLGFPSAPILQYLNLAAHRNSLARSTKSMRSLALPPMCKHEVSGSLSLPSRGPFHLSLTVLFAIGHWVVFRLGGRSPRLQTGFHVSGPTLDTRQDFLISRTGVLPSSQ